MDIRKENKVRNAMKPKTTKRKEKKYKSGRFIRRKSLRSFGNFMGRILKTLGTLAHFGDAEPPDAEDDDGGFGQSASGVFRDDCAQISREGGSVKKSSTVSSSHGGSVKDRLSWCYGDKTPGVLGLKNHGNTCFMNAVVQCLSNTDLLAEYLGLEQYKSDLCHRRVNGEVRGEEPQTARGEVTEQLASLVRGLWTLEYTPQLSVEFKVAYWNTYERTAIRELEGSQSGAINGMHITQDSKHFVTGGDDKMVKVWDFMEGAVTHIGVAHSGSITCVKICSNSSTLISTSDDGAIFRWRFPHPPSS